MPFYEYRPLSGECGLCNGTMRTRQNINAEAHKVCPYCRQDVERIISLPQRHIMSRNDILKDSKVAGAGFAKYVRSGDGQYELAAGPDDAPKTFTKGVNVGETPSED